ncbi:MAG: hypothetical protein ACI4AX_00540 [Muribaculaceae bacterium]
MKPFLVFQGRLHIEVAVIVPVTGAFLLPVFFISISNLGDYGVGEAFGNGPCYYDLNFFVSDAVENPDFQSNLLHGFLLAYVVHHFSELVCESRGLESGDTFIAHIFFSLALIGADYCFVTTVDKKNKCFHLL